MMSGSLSWDIYNGESAKCQRPHIGQPWLGEAAIQALMEDQHNIMVGIHNNEIVYVPFDQAIKNDKPIDKNLIRVLNELSI